MRHDAERIVSSGYTMFIQIESFMSFEVFHIRVFLFIHIPSVPVQWDMVISSVMISRHMQIVGRKAA